MMSAPSLPTPPGAMPAGLSTFLANIGQLPADGGESPSFDKLLAAAPVATDAAPKINIAQALPTKATTPTTDVLLPVETDAAVAAPVKTEAAKTDAAAALAANLLTALKGAAPASGRPLPAEPGPDTKAESAETSETVIAAPTAPAAPAADLAAVVAAIIPATAAKPAKPGEAATVRADPGTPAAPAPARARDSATPLPILAGAEPQTAKPVDAAPSITILFPQHAAQGVTSFADAAAPVQLAERVLDMDSDGTWIDQLARDIAATKSDSGDISFRLMPRHLGRLDVAMQMGDDGVALKMDTQHEVTATIVNAAQGRLVEELRQQGVRVAGAEVTCTPGETGPQSQNQGQGRAAGHDTAHLIETATERAEPRAEGRAAERRGRFA